PSLQLVGIRDVLEDAYLAWLHDLVADIHYRYEAFVAGAQLRAVPPVDIVVLGVVLVQHDDVLPGIDIYGLDLAHVLLEFPDIDLLDLLLNVFNHKAHIASIVFQSILMSSFLLAMEKNDSGGITPISVTYPFMYLAAVASNARFFILRPLGGLSQTSFGSLSSIFSLSPCMVM